MRIFINNKPFTINEYDDIISILNAYALKSEDELPEYFRITEKEFELKKDATLTVQNVKDELSRLSLDKFSEPSVFESLRTSYPGLDKKDLGILWVITNVKEITELSIQGYVPKLKEIDRVFSSSGTIMRYIQEYKKVVHTLREQLKKDMKKRDKIIDKLDTIDSKVASDFNLEDIVLSLVLKVHNNETLEEIFDIMDVSEIIPFICLSYKGRYWFKVYTHIHPPNKWIIDESIAKDGLHFRVLNATSNSEMRSQSLYKIYSSGTWTQGENEYDGNNIKITFSAQSGIEEKDIIGGIRKSLGGRLKYDIIQQRQLGIKGTFTVDDIVFNNAIFNDMVLNDDIVSYFMFASDRVKSSIDKTRLYLYYRPNQKGIITNSLAIIITPYVDEDNKWLQVRVSKAKNIQQANAFKHVFSKLLGLYYNRYETVVDDYSYFIKDASTLLGGFIKKPKKKKEDKKTGKRLHDLKTLKPDIFQAGYSKQCSPKNKQPKIVSEREKDKLLNTVFNGNDHKVLKFPLNSKDASYYVCEPREETDENKANVWPGVVKNKETANRDIYPYLPCCFNTDQYTKEKSGLLKYMNEQAMEKVPLETESRIGKNLGYVLRSDKSVPPGRFGMLPHYINGLIQSAGYEPVTKQKQTFLPILRSGVILSPDSFIHCMEKAFNPRYTNLTEEERIAVVSGVRKKISKTNFAVGKQELYDYTDDEIKDILTGKDNYIDPDIFVSLVSAFYKCNIFMYFSDAMHPNGEIVIPRHSLVYLPKKIDKNKDTVFIFKMPLYNMGFPYQCELLTKYNPKAKTQNLQYIFKDDPLINKAIEIFNEANSVVVVTPDKGSFSYSEI